MIRSSYRSSPDRGSGAPMRAANPAPGPLRFPTRSQQSLGVQAGFQAGGGVQEQRLPSGRRPFGLVQARNPHRLDSGHRPQGRNRPGDGGPAVTQVGSDSNQCGRHQSPVWGSPFSDLGPATAGAACPGLVRGFGRYCIIRRALGGHPCPSYNARGRVRVSITRSWSAYAYESIPVHERGRWLAAYCSLCPSDDPSVVPVSCRRADPGQRLLCPPRQQRRRRGHHAPGHHRGDDPDHLGRWWSSSSPTAPRPSQFHEGWTTASLQRKIFHVQREVRAPRVLDVAGDGRSPAGERRTSLKITRRVSLSGHRHGQPSS